MSDAPERVETGVVQVGDDWPGLFIRGDDCAGLIIGGWLDEGHWLADEIQKVSVGHPDHAPVRLVSADIHEAEVARLREALEEIVKREGPYSRDPLTHAENVIDNMADIARRALEGSDG